MKARLMPGFLITGAFMYDTNWELIDGDVAHEIEVLNLSSQINVIEALLRYFLHHHPAGENGCAKYPNQNALKELHRTATFLLLERPGEYRDCDVQVAGQDGTVYHVPPAFAEVVANMDLMFQRLGERWDGLSPVDAAAFTLWLINWVHPFKNGNGRSARAFCYTCLCLKLGFVLPGSPTVLDLIKANDGEYQNALRVADAGFNKDGEPDLTAMSTLIERLLIQQLESVPA